jgi:hypothetical protein
MNNNVIELTEQPGEKVADILRFSIASKLGISPDNLFETALKLTADLVAKIPDGYVLYQCNGLRRAALVINIEIEGYCFPFIFHKDGCDDDPAPVGLLYADVQYSHLGSFINYISSDENIFLYSALVSHMPASLNGIGVIQAIENAKKAGVVYFDDLGIRRVAKATTVELAD